jgi:predicted NBD/HSP70 family sugar kinase
MYLGVDIGGTKTLVSTIEDNGVIIQRVKFPTPQNYNEFLKQLFAVYEGFNNREYVAAGIGIPAVTIDRRNGVGHRFGNLKWHDVAIREDVQQLIKCPVVVENDAKLAGLSEAMLVKDCRKVLYVTISTGIGFALIVDGIIDPAFGDGGGRTLLVEHDGKRVAWESFASGKAIVKKYGLRAEDIKDEHIWTAVSGNIAVGLIDLIAVTEPDIVIIGGGVGRYLTRYQKHLRAALKKYESPLLAIPPIRRAKRPDDAVIYGCYDLAKAVYG